MIVDSSAVLAILRDEDDAAVYAAAIERATSRAMSAASVVVTAAIVDGSRDPVASRRLDEFLREAEIAIEPVTVAQAKIAREAYRDFGKGSGHKARLNFGDCFAYALAKERGEALLFKGDDFVHTDIASAPA